VDWIIIGVVALLALYGYAQGFLAGALTLAGFAAGAFIGTRFGPLLLHDGKDSPYAPLFGLAGALLAGAVLASGFEGVGERLRFALRRAPGFSVVDGLLGAALMAVVGLGVAWVAGAIALQTPGARELRADIQRSAILTRLNDVLPSRRLLNALARFDPFPSVSGPGAGGVRAPEPRIAHDPQIRAAAASVVKVRGTACGLGVEGSGWIAKAGLVVTNAHVVAGEDDTTVAGHDATVVGFDVHNDLAVLRVDGLGGAALPIARDPRPGTSAAVLGYPLDGPYRVRAARLGATRTVLTQDAYGEGPVRRSIVALRGKVQPGNSGGPVVDGRGRVVATVFAKTTKGPRGGYGVPATALRATLAKLSASAPPAVSTGPCAR
jgi:S1-C subfamily serine protease